LRKPVAIIILVTILLTASIPSHTSANPMTVNSAYSGSFFCLSSNISMPEANVNISLTCREVIPTRSSGPIFVYEAEMNSSFLVISECDENTTIAFAYPAAWRNWYTLLELDNLEFEVFVDNIEVSTQILIFSAIGFEYYEYWGEDLKSWGFLSDNEFVLFNISLEATKSSLVEVYTNFTLGSDTDIFEFEYCVGTAKTWNGTTIEEVRIQLANTSQYLENSFYPENSLVVTSGVDTTMGCWNLNFSSVTEDYVGVSIMQKQWPYNNTINFGSTTTNTRLTQEDTQAMTLFVGISVTLIVVVIIRFIRRT